MIKMVITDVDGTLIPEGTKEFPAELLEIVQKLQTYSIGFGTASGRQFNSLYALFQSVADDMLFFCENGTIVYDGQGNLLDHTPIPRDIVADLFRHAVGFEDAEILLGAISTAYIHPKSEDFVHLMRDVKNSAVTVAETIDDVAEDVCKISVYCPSGSEKFAAYLKEHWIPTCRMEESAENWLDFSVGNKADGIKKMLTQSGISLKDVMYFGDNYNDLDVLRMVGHPWLMAHAVPQLRAEFPRQTESVVQTLHAFLTQLEAD